MSRRLQRSIQEPVRAGLSWKERWEGSDEGLIGCWENGREDRLKYPSRAASAVRRELPELSWKGGVKEKLKAKFKDGTLMYLATWQGLRGEDLDIDLEGEHVIVCTKTGQAVVFSAKLPVDDE